MAHPEHGIFVFVERADGRLYSIHAGKATLLAEGRMVLAFTEDGLEALVKNQGHAVVARRNDLGKASPMRVMPEAADGAVRARER